MLLSFFFPHTSLPLTALLYERLARANTERCCCNGSWSQSSVTPQMKWKEVNCTCHLLLWAKRQVYRFIDKTLLTAWSSLRRVCAFVHHHQTCQSSKAASSRLVWKQNKREMNLVPMVTALLLSTVPGHHIGPPCIWTNQNFIINFQFLNAWKLLKIMLKSILTFVSHHLVVQNVNFLLEGTLSF